MTRASPRPPRAPDRPPDGPTILYGRNAVREALRGRRHVLRVWRSESARDVLRGDDALAFGTVAAEPPVSVVPREELERLCGSADHQGIVCEVEAYPYVSPDELLSDQQAVLFALDQVQDPQNLGAICRSAECAGVAGVVLPQRRSAHVTPAVCRASAGAVEHLRIARVRNLAEFLARAKEAGAWVYGAEAGAPTPYTEPDYRGRVVLVLGGEGSGLRPRVKAACDQLVSVPLRGRTESLNVSAAAAVLAYRALEEAAGGASAGRRP
jgi:23S rRNA (guanosine2251-2'-O)-methyltransferase